MVDFKIHKNLCQFGWCRWLPLLFIIFNDVYINWNDVLVLSLTVPYRYFRIRQKQVKQYQDQSLHVICPSSLSHKRLQSITRLQLSKSSFWTMLSSSSISLPSLDENLLLQSQQPQPQQQQQQRQEELSTIDECIHWIDQYCHRTFLHAVIASDYHFLYRGCNNVNNINTKKNQHQILKPVPIIQYNEIYDLLHIDTYGINGLQYFQKLETLLQNEIVRPSIGHLATTSYIDANQWGDYVASIWPASSTVISSSSICTSNSNDACTTRTTTMSNNGSNGYAWFMDGGLFYPRTILMDESDDSTIRQSLVVISDDHNDDVSSSNINDTIDHVNHRCGEYYLEDALQYTNCEILFTSNTFLTIPIIYEKELRNHLRKNAFLI